MSQKSLTILNALDSHILKSWLIFLSSDEALSRSGRGADYLYRHLVPRKLP